MMEFNELKFQSNAVRHLAHNLNEGSLVLFLGAGASKGFGLPTWLELVNFLRTDVGLPVLADVGVSAEDLQHAADEVQDKLGSAAALINLIEKYLYDGMKDLASTKIFDNHLLVSISALLMGSKRGHVTRVVTLNYDNMLEWFLSLFGFIVKTIHKLPELEGSEDVRIYHPHGFIPHPLASSIKSDFVILGMDSANQRLGTPGDPWFEMTRHILNTGFCLFIGMSEQTLSDRAIAPLFRTSGERVKPERPLGIWVLLNSLSTAKEAEFQRNNIVPLIINGVEDISKFLLEICQESIKKFTEK